MTRPQVVFVDHVARLSGAEIALLGLFPALAEHVDARVLLGEDGPLVGRLVALGVPVEVMQMPPSLRDVRKDAVTPARLDPRALLPLPAYVARLARRLRELEPDLVHTNSLKAALVGGVAARLARIPVLWHVRDRISEDYLPWAAVRLVRLAARTVPTAVVANSQATLRTLPPLRSSAVVYNPVAPQSVERSPGEHPLTFGVLGRLAPWKGQLVFLESFASAFRGSETRARIIGAALFGEESYAAMLHERAKELGIAGQVEFRGHREDVWAELAALDVLVHCSVSAEPFGQVVLEGMAAGLPVIASDAGGPAELITDGVDGLLVPQADRANLAHALRRLAEDPALRSKLGTAAKIRSRQFTPERTVQQLCEVYATILDGKPSGRPPRRRVTSRERPPGT